MNENENAVQQEIPIPNKEIPQQALKPQNPLFPFMAAGSLIYALFLTFCLYKNASGITYPFFAGGTCFFFFCYLKKSGLTAKTFSRFLTVVLLLLGISTFLTANSSIHFFNGLAIFVLFFYMVLHNLYEDKHWDLIKYLGSGIYLIFSSLMYIPAPFQDISAYLKARREAEQKPESKLRYVFFGIAVSLPLLIIVFLLLSSADIVFNHFFGVFINRFYSFYFEGELFQILFLVFFTFFVSYCFLMRMSVRDIKEEAGDRRTGEPVMGITILSLLSVLYLIFCYIQIVYLFGGFGTLPRGYTYAEYAREGFFQLVFVCIINLSVILIFLKCFRKNNVLKGLLTLLSLCTYIMIASSAYRMLLYISFYYLTFLRILVLWGLLVIFLLLSGALVLIYKEDIPYVRFCVITVSVLYLLFSLSRPDYWTARYNLSHDNTDYRYLSHLSADAAPALYSYAQINGWFLPDGKEIFSFQMIAKDKEEMTPRKWNLSKWTAIRLYEKFYHLE